MFRAFASPIVPRCRLDVGVTRQALHRADVGAGIEQIADERAPDVVRRKWRDPRRQGTVLEHVHHARVGQAQCGDGTAFPETRKKRG